MSIVLHWFRQDLRVSDNPALSKAVQAGEVLPIYIVSPENMGSASRVWLHHSLESLNVTLGETLNCYKGNPLAVIRDIVERVKPSAVFWNRCYEPENVRLDTEVVALLQSMGVTASCSHETLLWEPETTCKPDGTAYKVFTPFYNRGCLANTEPRSCYDVPDLSGLKTDGTATSISELGLIPKAQWPETMMASWDVGEHAAQKKLADFLSSELDGYHAGRDFPSKSQTSYLSPHLHIGEISPHQIWWETEGIVGEDVDCFRRELGWREFSYTLLHFFPDMPTENFNKKYDRFPWKDNAVWLSAWQTGQTGIPIVDAGMRELWQTGYMHNRVRMIVASFLIKNLNIHWRHGAEWFFDCLVDADLANNSVSWQWVAGSGVDAAPYFRVFNPVTQGQKFDKKGDYTRRFVPELKNLPDNVLFAPWEASECVLNEAGVVLGHTYPRPLVDLKQSRLIALENAASLNG